MFVAKTKDHFIDPNHMHLHKYVVQHHDLVFIPICFVNSVS